MQKALTKIDWDTENIRLANGMIRAVGHRLRQRIIELINTSEHELTVTEIYIKLRMDQSIVSQHLAILRRAGILTTERSGKYIYYKINHANIAKTQAAIASFNLGR